MSHKTTKKETSRNFPVIVYTGANGNAETALSWGMVEKCAHTERAEGWGADVYDLCGGVALVVGYDPFGNVALPYEFFRAWRNRAEKARFRLSGIGGVIGWRKELAARRAFGRRFVAAVRREAERAANA